MAEELSLDTEEASLTTEPVVETTTEPVVETAAPVAETETTAEVAAPDWPDDWREKATGGDAKAMQKLSKYASPKAVAEALLAAQKYISETRAVNKLGDKATPEQIKEYRESMGIPETPDKYDIADFKLSDTDKENIKGYLEKAHGTNQTPEQVKAGIQSYVEIVQKSQEMRRQQDATFTKESEDSLRGEWGNDFRRNVNLINSFLDNAPSGLKEKILTGRLSDGTPIGSDPDALRWLLQLELERNPVGVVTPGAGANMKQSVDDEIKKIETTMRDDRKSYNRDEKMQERYRQLLEYRLTQGKKAA